MNDELEIIVQNMLDAGESEENISLVISSYTSEDSKPVAEDVEDAELVSEDVSLDEQPKVEYLIDNTNVDKVELKNKLNDIEFVKGVKNGSINIDIKNDKELEELAKKQFNLTTESTEELTLIEKIPGIGKNQVTDFLGDLYRSAVQGYEQSKIVDPSLDLFYEGNEATDEEVLKFVESNKKIAEKDMQSGEMKDFNRVYEEAGGGWLGFVLGIAESPTTLPSMLVSSISSQISSALTSEQVAASATMGAGTGAAVGAALSPYFAGIGAIPGAISGAMTGSMTAMETGLTFSELLQEEIDGDLTAEKVRKILDNPEKLQELKNRALGRGVTIGAVELATLGLAKGVGGKIASAGFKGAPVVGAAVAAGIEVGGGGTGEYAGRVVAGQKMDVAEIGFEAFSGLGSAPISMGKQVLNLKNNIDRVRINSQLKNTPYKNITEAFDPSTPITESDINISRIKNSSKILNEQVDKKIKKAEITQEQGDNIKNNFRSTQDAANKINKLDLKKSDEVEVVSLLKEKNSLNDKIKSVDEPSLTESESTRVKDIDNRLKDISKADTEAKSKVEVVAATEQVVKAVKKSGLDIEVIELENEAAVEEFIKDKTDVSSSKAKEAGKQRGFILPDGKTIVINKNVAVKEKAVTTAGHEVFHAILFNTINKGDENAFALANAIKTQLSNISTEDFKNSDFAARIEQYKSDPDINEAAKAEEVLTLFSEAIATGDIKFEEGVFTKLKDFVRRILQNAGFSNIDFNDSKDVYNFVKDYNKSISKGKFTKAQVKAAKEGVVVSETLKDRVKDVAEKGVDETILKFSKSEVTELAKQYKKDPNKTNVEELIKQYDNVALKALGYDISKGTIAPEEAISFVNKEFDSILRRYDGSTEFSTWINSNIRPKRQAFYEEQIGKESETTSIDSEQARQVVDDSSETTDDRTEKEIRQSERKTKVAKRLKLEDKAIKEVASKIENIDLSKVNYKTLKNLANETIGEAFGISPKKILSNANLTKSEIANAQRYIKNNVDLLKALLPDGYNKDFKSTGVPKVLLDKFYNKRSVRSKTGAGLNVQNKKPNIGSVEFLEVFGFVEGKPTRADRNISARIIALANQTGKAITNQTVREQLQKDGMPESALQDIKSGTPVGMFSKSKDSKVKKQKGVKEKIKAIIENAGVKPLEVKGDGRIESIEYLINEFFPKLINEFGDATRFLLKSSTISPSGNEAISKNPDGSIKKTGGAIGRDQLFITDIVRTIKSKPETQKLLDEGKLGQLKDVLDLLKIDLNKNNNLENIKTATLPQKTPNIQRNLNTRKQHKEGSKAIISSLKKMYDADEKSLSGIAFLLYNANANSSFYRNLAQLVGVEQGSGKNNAREEHMFQAGPWAERTLEAITKSKKIFDSYNKWQADNYYQETITKESERLVDGKYRLDDGTFWNAKFQEHPYMKQQMDIAMKTGDFSKVPSPDIRKYNEFYGLNPNNIIREGLSDAKRYNVEVPKKLQNQNTEAFQVKLIFEQVTRKIDSKRAKKQLDQYLKIAPSQLKASKSTNKTLLDSKVLDVEGNLNIEDLLSKAASIDKALNIARDINAPVKKIRVFDFDDTLATTKSDVLFTAPNGTEGKLNAEEFATKGKELLDEGYVFDFSEFNKVTKGKPGPLLNLAKKIQDARGTEDVFVLTARAPQAAIAIKEFLDSQGLNIPLKNITGLGKSTGEAKANWMIDKAAEGYNDFYFADDAYQNVKAVKDVMSVIDVKSKVQQAKFSKSKDLSSDFNKIIEESVGIGAEKVFSDVKAQVRGAKAKRQKFFIPPSAEDMLGLVYTTLGKGKKGEAHLKFYQENLFDPYTRAMENLSTDRVNLMADFKKLKKELDVPKDLRKTTDSGFTNEQAVRVYLWNKTGENIPGLSKTDLKELNDIVDNNPKLKTFADQIITITKGDGYSKPGDNWAVGTITTDLIDILNTTKRSKYLETWKQNKDVIYSKENLNKLESVYGPKYREALENSLKRMTSGSNRISGGNKLSNQVLDYINNSTGVIMFLNMRSAILQTISAANFINWSFNNPLKAGKAFANQNQYWKDFVKLFNSDYLLDRRKGLKLNISESEIADIAATIGSKAKAKSFLNKLLQFGFLPTQYADSFAIASGGAMFYRNRISDLIKNEGKTEKEAEVIAMKEFRQISEMSQQSSDPSKISQQQSSDLGRIVLQFANTPMQYARIQKRAVQDIVNGRGNLKTNISKIAYYGFLQSMLFNVLQQAITKFGFDDDDMSDEDEKKLIKLANGMLDSSLRGLGVAGVTVQVLKNLGIDIYDRSKKDRPEFSDSWKKLLEFSPAIKSKLGKFQSAAYPFDSKKRRKEMFEKGFSIDNPAYESAAKVISATTNVPLDRLLSKFNNFTAANDEETETWQSIAMILGWSEWQIKGSKSKSKKKTSSRGKSRGSSGRK